MLPARPLALRIWLRRVGRPGRSTTGGAEYRVSLRMGRDVVGLFESARKFVKVDPGSFKENVGVVRPLAIDVLGIAEAHQG